MAPGSLRDKTALCFFGERGEGLLGQKRRLFLLEANTVFKAFFLTLAKADCDRGLGPWPEHAALTAHGRVFPLCGKGTNFLLSLNDSGRNRCCFFDDCIIFKLGHYFFFGLWIIKVPAWDPESILISAPFTGKSLVMPQPSAMSISLEDFIF